MSMKAFIIIAAVLLIFVLSINTVEAKETGKVHSCSKASFPVKASVEVLCEPVPVEAGGKKNLVYEILVSNLGDKPVFLDRIEVVNNANGEESFARYNTSDFETMITHFGKQPEKKDITLVNPGECIVAFIWVKIDAHKPTPKKLYHKISFRRNKRELIKEEPEVNRDAEEEPFVLEQPVVNVNNITPIKVKNPLYGEGWVAAEGPLNTNGYSHHRFGVITMDGKPRVPQRFAIDWMKFEPDGKLFTGDGSKNEDWYCYKEKIHSIADGVVLESKDGIPENVPLTSKRAVPMSMETLCGNYVFVKMDNGYYALYAHLIPGSVKVKPGDRVKTGQVLGLLGNSGNSDAPHLHFHITGKPASNVLSAEGVPYEIEKFQLSGIIAVPFTFHIESIKDIGNMLWKGKTKIKPEEKKNEMPMGYKVYNFPED